MTAFRISTVSPPVTVTPGSCQAERELAGWLRDGSRVEVTPEWIAENEAKQRAYEQRRKEWRELTGIKQT